MNYIQYLLKAKGRHGIHSPFVYDLIEKGLRAALHIRNETFRAHFPDSANKELLEKLFQYFRPNTYTVIAAATESGIQAYSVNWQDHDVQIAADHHATANQRNFILEETHAKPISPDIIILSAKNINSVVGLCERILMLAEENTIVVITGIRRDRQCKKAWDRMTAHTSVRASLDSWHTGVLLFRREFKEKQYFILRA